MALKYDWSQWHKRTDKGWAHNYLPVYDSLLRSRPVRAIFEIGILDGESIRMWSSIFPRARVVGVDIDDRTSLARELDNVIIHVGDAYNLDMVQEVKKNGPYDLIVEDGSHFLAHQCWAAENYVNLLSADGVLVVEDINSILEAHLIAQFLPAKYRNKSYIVDRRCASSEYEYKGFDDRNDIMLVVDIK